MRLTGARTVRLVGLLVAAAALYLWDGMRTDPPRPNPPAQGLSASPADEARRVVFVLCDGARQDDCVIDGDTIKHYGATIRLEDIDTPETHKHKCAAELALGRRATNRLLELVNAGPFTITRKGKRDQDRFGRKLRTVERNGVSLGEILVREGLAQRWNTARHGWCD